MGVILRAHPVRGESHIQRNANGEVATPERKYIGVDLMQPDIARMASFDWESNLHV